MTAEQKTRFVGLLREGPQGGLYELAAVGDDGEAQELVKELYGLFQAAEWPIQNFVIALIGRTASGIVLSVRNQESPPTHAMTVRRAFMQIGFQEPRIEANPGQPAGAVSLIVGRRAP